MKDITILIADDHTLVRETWSFFFALQEGYTVCGETGSGAVAVALARQLRPDVILMDINMPDMDGVEATYRIRECSPQSRVLAISMHAEPAYARRMMQAGARGYVTKKSSREEMFRALTAIMNGQTYVCQEIKDNLSELLLSGGGPEERIGALSERERAIIACLKKGYAYPDIARELGISVRTVEVHRHHILKKLNLKNTIALLHFLTQHHLDREG